VKLPVLVLLALGVAGLYFATHSDAASATMFWAMAGVGALLFFMLLGLGLFIRETRGEGDKR
jgi:hypothetical protein